MFSSNQVLKISGNMNQLEEAIDFVMKYSGEAECFTRSNKPAKCVYQTTDDGRYCIGWALGDEEILDGWHEYSFDYDPKIIAAIVKQWIEKSPKPIDENSGYDGSSHIGFMLQENYSSRWSEHKHIKNVHRCIIVIEPFWCFYAK